MIVELVRKDLIRRWRSPLSTIVMLVFPFMMAGMIGAINGGGGDGQTLPAVRVFLLDREDGILGGFLADAGSSPDSPMPIEIERVGDEGFERMAMGEASAMIVIPESFTEDLLDGRDVSLQVVRNPAEGIKPEIIEQGMNVVATYLDVAVKALGTELQRVSDLVDAETMPSVMVVTTLVGEFYQEMMKADRYLFPPVVEIATVKESDEETGDGANVFGYVLVMVSVMSVLFVAIRAVTDLYEDMRTGMLRRQLSTPMTVGALVFAKLLFALVFGVLVMAILLAAGTVFGWFGDALPLFGVFVHTVAFTAAAAGLMTVIVAAVKTEKQAGIVSWIVVMTMSSLGGSMFPLEFVAPGLVPVAKFTINYWAVEGYLDLIVRGRSLVETLLPIGVLAAVGVVTLGAGQWLMRNRLREVA